MKGSLAGRLGTLLKILMGGVLLLLVAVLFALWAAKETGERLDIGYGVATDPTPVRLYIADKVFLIPRNYIWSRSEWQGGRTQGVNLHALLPDFAPYTAENRHEFDRLGWGRKISIVLIEHDIEGSRTTGTRMTRDLVYERIVTDYVTGGRREIEEVLFDHGLRLQRLTPKPVTGRDLLVGKKQDGSFYWVLCTPEATVPYPSCSTDVEYSDHVTISYAFSRDFLSDWEVIDDRVLALIAEFELKGNEREEQDGVVE